jgi:hypothetical protein
MKFKAGDLVRWKAAFRVERPHLGIVLEDRDPARLYRYKVQWFTDNNSIGTYPASALMKVEDRGHEI